MPGAWDLVWSGSGAGGSFTLHYTLGSSAGLNCEVDGGSLTAPAAATTYSKADLCGPPANTYGFVVREKGENTKGEKGAAAA